MMTGGTVVGEALPNTPMSTRLGRRLLLSAVVPTLLYSLLLALMEFPALKLFRTHFIMGPGDGYQFLWNLWWFRHAVETGQNPYFTTLLHAPHGVSLLGHTLSPFNCVL